MKHTVLGIYWNGSGNGNDNANSHDDDDGDLWIIVWHISIVVSWNFVCVRYASQQKVPCNTKR